MTIARGPILPREVPVTTHTSLSPGLSPADRLRCIREAQRACLALVAARLPGHSEEFYLNIVRETVAAPGPSLFEAELLHTYLNAKREAEGRVAR